MEFRIWIRNYIHTKPWNVITHSCCKCNGDVANPGLRQVDLKSILYYRQQILNKFERMQ